MTIQQLNNKLTALLKKYIKASNHVDSGNLYNSIEFNCSFNQELKISFKTAEYIKYLDDGEFLNGFFALEETKKLIGEFITSSLEQSLKI